MATETHVISTGRGMDQALSSAESPWSVVQESAKIGWTACKKYLMVIPATASGTFSQVAGTISIPGDRFHEAKATIRIPVASHNSGKAPRDKHLLGPDFFHADEHPLLSFESTEIRRIEPETGAYEVTGLLTVRDTSVPLVLTGTLKPQPGAGRAHISLAGSFNRRDVEIVWNAVPMVKLHDDISLRIDVEIERSGRPGVH